jgi:hypothetical protein
LKGAGFGLVAAEAVRVMRRRAMDTALFMFQV